MSPRLPDPARRSRTIALALVVLVGVGFVALRLASLHEARTDTRAETLDALREAIAAPPGSERTRAFDRAEEAAVRSVRSSAALLDAEGAFLLSLVERLEAAAHAPEPAPDASTYTRLDWLIAHHQLDAAAALVEHARTDPDLAAERLALYADVIEALREPP